ncbi:MAG TPA: hypothetical protein VFR97_04500 [Capillimicrobium sp.]|nr:hypothetical protein [Capillimicrobium sp.]
MSFFDDDDQPTRTSRTPRPRRAAGRTGGAPRSAAGDHQQLLIRRAVALGVLALLLILIIIGFNSCRTNAKKNAMRDYNTDVATLVRDSDERVGKPFFDLLQSGDQSPVTLETQINQYRVTAEDQVERAENLDVPDELVPAQRDFLLVLQFRAEALGAIASKIRTALGSEDAADQAVDEIAGQMQKLLASDVIYGQRVAPLIYETLADNDVTGDVASSKFLPNLGWLDPETVGPRIGGGGGGASAEPTTPGPHGHGLVSVAADDVTLQPEPAVNRLTASADTTFVVSFQNQGAADEQDVRVSVRISGAGAPITVNKTVPQTVAGATAEVEIPLGQSPPIGTPVTIRVVVEPVPGEQTTDNNRSEYTALFTR